MDVIRVEPSIHIQAQNVQDVLPARVTESLVCVLQQTKLITQRTQEIMRLQSLRLHDMKLRTGELANRARAVQIQTASSAVFALKNTAPIDVYNGAIGDGMNAFRRMSRPVEQLFLPGNRSAAIETLMGAAHPPPPLALLNAVTGRDCLALYSDPQFFFNQWQHAEEARYAAAEQARKKEGGKRRTQKQLSLQIQPRQVDRVDVKVYSSMGAEFADVALAQFQQTSQQQLEQYKQKVAAQRQMLKLRHPVSRLQQQSPKPVAKTQEPQLKNVLSNEQTSTTTDMAEQSIPRSLQSVAQVNPDSSVPPLPERSFHHELTTAQRLSYMKNAVNESSVPRSPSSTSSDLCTSTVPPIAPPMLPLNASVAGTPLPPPPPPPFIKVNQVSAPSQSPLKPEHAVTASSKIPSPPSPPPPLSHPEHAVTTSVPSPPPPPLTTHLENAVSPSSSSSSRQPLSDRSALFSSIEAGVKLRKIEPTHDKNHAEANRTRASGDSRSSLLDQIRDGGFHLRKTKIVENGNAADTNSSTSGGLISKAVAQNKSVAAILARRAAIQGDSDDDEWD